MDAAAKQLEQLNQEIGIVSAEAKGAQNARLSATDPQRNANLKEVWHQLPKDKEALIADRKALEAKRMGLGVLTPLLAQKHLVSAAKCLVEVAQCSHIFVQRSGAIVFSNCVLGESVCWSI